MKINTRFIAQAAIIAAVYAVLTVILAPISYGPMQVRISEALTVLPALTPAAIPGLFVGCILANVISPYGILDMVMGSLATLIAAVASRKLANAGKSALVPLPPVLSNGLILATMWWILDGAPWLANFFWVAFGELIACYCVGYPLMKLLERRKDIFKL